MAGTGRTGPERKLTQAAKHFYLRKVRSYTAVVLTAFEENRRLHCRLSVSLPWSKVWRAFCPQPPPPPPLPTLLLLPFFRVLARFFNPFLFRAPHIVFFSFRLLFRYIPLWFLTRAPEFPTRGFNPEGTYKMRVEARITLSVRRRRTEATQGGRREVCGAENKLEALWSQKLKAWIWKGNYGPSLEQTKITLIFLNLALTLN